MPNSTKKPYSLASALFTSTKQEVLALLFGQSNRSFFFSEIVKHTKKGSGGVQKELDKLTQSGLVRSWKIANQKHYQADENSILFDELKSIVLKTVGLRIPLTDALEKIKSQIHLAFVYGSVADNSDRSESDIDLFLVTDTLELEKIYRVLQPVEAKLGRTINPTVFNRAEFDKKRNAKNGFLPKVLSRPKIEIIGSINEQ